MGLEKEAKKLQRIRADLVWLEHELDRVATERDELQAHWLTEEEAWQAGYAQGRKDQAAVGSNFGPSDAVA